MENGCINTVWLFHHVTDRTQHLVVDDEGNIWSNFQKSDIQSYLLFSVMVKINDMKLLCDISTWYLLDYFQWRRCLKSLDSVSRFVLIACLSQFFSPPKWSCFLFDQQYFKDAWNLFDFITVIGSIIDAIVSEITVGQNGKVSQCVFLFGVKRDVFGNTLKYCSNK